jgi:hypothetical protein
MRKVYVVVTTRIVIETNDNVEVTEVLQDMDYNFISKTDGANIVDTEIREWEVQDSFIL